MLLSKAKLYSESDQKTSFYARAFTHPARLEIIRSLRRADQLSVQQLATFHPLTMAAFSQHLGILRETEVIDFEPHYPYLLYYLDNGKFAEARTYMLNYLEEE